MKPPAKRFKSVESPIFRQFKIVLTDCSKETEVQKPDVPEKSPDKYLVQFQSPNYQNKRTNVNCSFSDKNASSEMGKGKKRKLEPAVGEKHQYEKKIAGPNDKIPMCRLCLEAGKRDMKPIMRSEDDEFLAKRIFDCTSINVLQETMEENFPKSICEDCRINIERCYNFRQFCLKNNQTLKTLVLFLSPEKNSQSKKSRSTALATSSKVEDARDKPVLNSKKATKEKATWSVKMKEKDDNARLIAQFNKTQKMPKLKKLVIVVPRCELPQKQIKGIESEKRLVVSLERLGMDKYMQNNSLIIRNQGKKSKIDLTQTNLRSKNNPQQKQKTELNSNVESKHEVESKQKPKIGPNLAALKQKLKLQSKPKVGSKIMQDRGHQKPSLTSSNGTNSPVITEPKNVRAPRMMSIPLIDSDEEGGKSDDEVEFIPDKAEITSQTLVHLKKRPLIDKIPLMQQSPVKPNQSSIFHKSDVTAIVRPLKTVPLQKLIDGNATSPLSSIETAFINVPPEIAKSVSTVTIPMKNVKIVSTGMIDFDDPAKDVDQAVMSQRLTNEIIIQNVRSDSCSTVATTISPTPIRPNSNENSKQKEKKECEICQAKVNNLYAHKRNKHSNHFYMCELCHRNFATPIQLEKHTECHVKRRMNNQHGKFACEICNLEFLSHSHQYEHMNSMEHQMNLDLTIARPTTSPIVNSSSEDTNPIILDSEPVPPQLPSTPSSTRSIQYQDTLQSSQNNISNYGQPLDFMTQENEDFYHIVRQLGTFESTP